MYSWGMRETGTHTHCARCGRTLTDPRSIGRGVGPVCARRIAAAAPTMLATIKPAQVTKALDLIADGGIATVSLGHYLTVSSNGQTRYETTANTCSCPAGSYGRDCYHRVAASLIAA